MESCYIDADGDGYRTSALTNSSDLTCSSAGLAHAATPGGDCCDTGIYARYANPAAGSTSTGGPRNAYTGFFTQPTPCGGWDWDCNGIEESGPLVTITGAPATGTSSGICASNTTCVGSTRTNGWTSGPPTTCGATAQYSDGCSVHTICVPACNSFCSAANENIALDCR